MIETPALTALAEVSAALLGEKSSGSMSAAQIGLRLVLSVRYFSTAPGAFNSCPCASEVIYERVVDVDVGPFGWIP